MAEDILKLSVVMDAEEAQFLSRSKLSEYRNRVNHYVVLDRPVTSSGKRLTPIEKAELLESLATLEFYEGNWHQAVQSFRQSLTDFDEVEERRIPEQLVSSHILVRSHFFIHR